MITLTLKSRRCLAILLEIPLLLLAITSARAEKTIKFSGYEWIVKNSPVAGPGPNSWDENNVSVDEQGRLHLKITQRDGKWHCAQVNLKERLGFGTYQWQVEGRVDQLDPQIVLGLFTYTRPDVGPDGTNEIDIEFARWGDNVKPPGNFSVYPAMKEGKQRSHRFDFKLEGNYTTQRFHWTAQSVNFQMLGGHRDDNQNEIANWLYVPQEPEKYIPQKPLPVHINFWLFRGKPPQNAQEAEIIIRRFSFTPAEAK